MLRRSLLLSLASLAVAAPAHAAIVSVERGIMRVAAGPGEENALTLSEVDPFDFEGDDASTLPLVDVSDRGSAPLSAGPGCEAVEWDEGSLSCAKPNRIVIDAGDGDDYVRVDGSLPVTVRGGAGDDYLYGGDGPDVLLGERGADSADGGEGRDRIEVRDRRVDSVLCGGGRDSVRAEVLDSLDFACERVNYGPPGKVGRLRTRSGGGRFVPVPGQPGTTVDRRILPNVLQLIRRYKVRLGDCFARSGHSALGEHPLGLACGIVPGPGGSWNDVDHLARWAEPRQNRPRPPFSWVGYDGDYNHGRGNHLHLSWAHSPGRRFRPVRTVWVWQVRGR